MNMIVRFIEIVYSKCCKNVYTVFSERIFGFRTPQRPRSCPELSVLYGARFF